MTRSDQITIFNFAFDFYPVDRFHETDHYDDTEI